jgi:hypothetical protein
MLRSTVINCIISKYNLVNPDYLEIGVWEGVTFRDVNTLNKDGVDPGQYCDSVYVNYKMTSDEFFARHIKKKYDIIFIDGLHTAHQVSKDIYNSINHLKPGGFLVLDDVFPHSEREQMALDLSRSGSQTGDVWKGVYNVIDELISMSSDIYFIKDVERGNLVLKIENTNTNITIDPTIPTENVDGRHPVEWDKYSFQTDYVNYLNRLEVFNKSI